MQPMAEDFTYYELKERKKSRSVELIFRDWHGSSERLAVLSPHDDDAILGAAYLSLGAKAEGASVHVIVLCDGRAGYSTVEKKESIVSVRKVEASNAYSSLGIEQIRMEYPDFSLSSYMGWVLPGGLEGTFPKIIRRLREIGVTRLLIPNEHREHPDHEAASMIGMFDGPQVGDPIMVHYGQPVEIKSYVKYSVWADYSPLNALQRGRRARGNCIVKVSERVEKKIGEALREFRSQERIIEGLIGKRKERLFEGSYLEPYLKFEPRPPIIYDIYKKEIQKIDDESGGA